MDQNKRNTNRFSYLRAPAKYYRQNVPITTELQNSGLYEKTWEFISSSCARIIMEIKQQTYAGFWRSSVFDDFSVFEDFLKRKEPGLCVYEQDTGWKNHKSTLFNGTGDPFSAVNCPQSLGTFEHFPLHTTQFSWVQGTLKINGSRKH